MEFIKWWWARRAAPEKLLLFLITDVIISLICLPFLGLYSFLLFVSLLIIGLLLLIVYHIVDSIKSQLKEFRKEKEKEADLIVKKLQGITQYGVDSPGPTQEMLMKQKYASILDQLRQRNKP